MPVTPPLPPSCVHQKCFQTFPNVPLGAKLCLTVGWLRGDTEQANTRIHCVFSESRAVGTCRTGQEGWRFPRKQGDVQEQGLRVWGSREEVRSWVRAQPCRAPRREGPGSSRSESATTARPVMEGGRKGGKGSQRNQGPPRGSLYTGPGLWIFL